MQPIKTDDVMINIRSPKYNEISQSSPSSTVKKPPSINNNVEIKELVDITLSDSNSDSNDKDKAERSHRIEMQRVQIENELEYTKELLSSIQSLNKKKPKLKQAKYADDKVIKQLKRRFHGDGNHNIQSTEDVECGTARTAITEIRADKAWWNALNRDNECDAAWMALEASSKCNKAKECGACSRIDFVLQHVVALNVTDDALSSFMNSLEGYSHIQLSKDYRHFEGSEWSDFRSKIMA